MVRPVSLFIGLYKKDDTLSRVPVYKNTDEITIYGKREGIRYKKEFVSPVFTPFFKSSGKNKKNKVSMLTAVFDINNHHLSYIDINILFFF